MSGRTGTSGPSREEVRTLWGADWRGFGHEIVRPGGPRRGVSISPPGRPLPLQRGRASRRDNRNIARPHSIIAVHAVESWQLLISHIRKQQFFLPTAGIKSLRRFHPHSSLHRNLLIVSPYLASRPLPASVPAHFV